MPACACRAIAHRNTGGGSSIMSASISSAYRLSGYLMEVARRLRLPLRKMVGLLFLNLLWIAFEAIGVAVLYPVLKLIQGENLEAKGQFAGRYWRALHQLSALTGIPISLGVLLLISFAFLSMRQVVRYLNVYYSGKAMRWTADQVRRQAFNGFMRVQSSVQEKMRPGEIANNLSMELDRALSSLFSIIRTIGVGIQMGAYLAGLLLLSPVLTILSLLVFGFLGFLSRGLLIAIKDAGRDITDANVELAGFIVERLQHVRLIRLSGTEKLEMRAFGKLSGRRAETQVRQRIITTQMSLLPEPVAVGFGYAVLFVGSQIFGFGLGELGLFLIILIKLVPVVLSGINEYGNIIGKWPSVEKVDGFLLELLNAREPRGGDKLFQKLSRNVTYDHVAFTYSGSGSPALYDVTVEMPAHRISALVGQSGAGKSTFVDLLPQIARDE